MASDTLEWIFQRRHRKKGNETQGRNSPWKLAQESRFATFLKTEISHRRTRWRWTARIPGVLNSSIQPHSLDTKDTCSVEGTTNLNSTRKWWNIKEVQISPTWFLFQWSRSTTGSLPSTSMGRPLLTTTTIKRHQTEVNQVIWWMQAYLSNRFEDFDRKSWSRFPKPRLSNKRENHDDYGPRTLLAIEFLCMGMVGNWMDDDLHSARGAY